MTIDKALEAKILRHHFVEHWGVNTIARQLGVHHSAVDRVLSQAGLPKAERTRQASIVDPYHPMIIETLAQYPRLSAARLYAMAQARGFTGGASQFRAHVAQLRPRKPSEAYLRLRTLPGEQGQIDWGHFGHVQIGRAKRPLMAFVMVLSWSRQIFLRFYLNQRMDNFLRGHVAAFSACGGVPRVLLYDNLRSAVLERQGDAIRFHPTLLELSAHYCFEPRPVAPARGNEKGRVERAIRYIRDSFFAGRQWSDVDDLNAQADAWCSGFSAKRPCPEDPSISVREAFEQERVQLIGLPDNPYPSDERLEVSIGKIPYARFDLNDYSVPHTQVRRTLTVQASLTQVRVLKGSEEVAEHRRVYGKGEQVEDPAHLEALLSTKRAARHHRGQDRLAQAAPSSRELLQQAAHRGTPLSRATAELVQLLDDYGAGELEHAITDALNNDVLHPSGVRQVLERRREQRDRAPPITLTLPDNDKARNIVVRAPSLALYDLLAHWDETPETELPWVRRLIAWEEVERRRRGLERRLGAAHIGRFKPLADFDWSWPAQYDKAAVSGFMTLGFIQQSANIILVGPNGVGKSMIAQNIAHHAVMQGHSALFVNAAQMLGDLAAQDGDNALRRRLKHYAHPDVLVIDEIGYLSYGNRHADLLFNIINRRYELKPTIVSTNRPFSEWSEVFPNAACVVSIVDRLVHHSEILVIEGESYRMKEAKERAARKKKSPKPRRAGPTKATDKSTSGDK